MSNETPAPTGRRLGYVRVSKSSMSVDGQIKKLMEQGGIERLSDIYTDHGVSGAKTSRPALDRLIADVQPGDVVVVFKLDRLGRSSGHVITLIETLVNKNVHVESIEDGLNTRTLAGATMLKMLALFAAMEREFVRERTRAGLDAAAESGRRGGRPAAMTPEQIEHAQQMHDKGKSAQAIAAYFKVSRASVYRVLGPKQPA